MKREYIEAELEIIDLIAVDIVTASVPDGGDGEDSWSGYY